jgi:hypothetical protein
MVRVVQAAHRINFLLGVDTGGVQGLILGNTIEITWSKLSNGGLICGSALTGTATVSNATITGSVSGRSNGHGCFPCDSDTITFTLQRQ